MDDENKRLREISGHFNSSDPLTSFLYEVLRDGCPAGVAEEALKNASTDKCEYTNGWLAKYAENLKDRLLEKYGLAYEHIISDNVCSDGWIKRLSTRIYGMKIKKSLKEYTCFSCDRVIDKGSKYLWIEYRCGGVFTANACEKCKISAWDIEKLHHKRVKEEESALSPV